jgi:hypothetical protein
VCKEDPGLCLSFAPIQSSQVHSPRRTVVSARWREAQGRLPQAVLSRFSQQRFS